MPFKILSYLFNISENEIKKLIEKDIDIRYLKKRAEEEKVKDKLEAILNKGRENEGDSPES